MGKSKIIISILAFAIVFSLTYINAGAASKNYVSAPVATTRDKDYSSDIVMAPKLRIEAADDNIEAGAVFVLTLSPTAEWTYNDVGDISQYFDKKIGTSYESAAALTNQSLFTYNLDALTPQYVQIKLNDALLVGNYMLIPIIFKIDGIAEATVTVSDGEVFGISGGTYVFANKGGVNSAKVEATGAALANGNNINGNVSIAVSAGLGDAEITLTLPSGFAFDETNRNRVTLTGEGSYSSAKLFNVSFNQSKNEMYVRYSGTQNSTSPGKINIGSIGVNALDNAPEGEISMSFSGFKTGNSFRFGEYRKEVPEEVTEENAELDKTSDETTERIVVMVSGSKTVIINREEQEFDTAPFNDEAGRMMVPLRFLANAFGIGDDAIKWDENNKQVTIAYTQQGQYLEIVFTIGSSDYLVNQTIKTMDTRAIIKDSYTFVPIRYAAEAMDFSVVYDDETKTATFDK